MSKQEKKYIVSFQGGVNLGINKEHKERIEKVFGWNKNTDSHNFIHLSGVGMINTDLIVGIFEKDHFKTQLWKK